MVWINAFVILAEILMAIMIVGRTAFGLTVKLAGYDITEQTVTKNNSAAGIRLGAFLLAFFVAYGGIVHPTGLGLGHDINLVAWYGFLLMGFLIASLYVNDFCILYGFSNNHEVFENNNMEVAVIEGATLIGTGYMLLSAFAGWHGGFWVSVGWFVVGQGFLIFIARLYQIFVPQLFQEIEKHNMALALSFSLFLLAGSMVMGSAIHGEFSSWMKDLWMVLIYFLSWLPCMVAASWLADLLIFPGVKLRDEVLKDKNIGAGFIEGVAFVGVTLLHTAILG